VGTALVSTGLLNFPRVAVASTGDIFVAYRDGTMASEFEVYLRVRPVGGSFAQPVNVSNSAGLLSDDISLAMSASDALELVWVDEANENVNNFEVVHATRSAAGALTTPVRFATQGGQTWVPSATQGGAASWHFGGAAGGDLYVADADGAPVHVFPAEQGGSTALARAADGSLHLAYTTVASPRLVRYAARSAQ
jgi:hypothetical protein